MKTLILCLMVLSITACGKNSKNNSGIQTQSQNPVVANCLTKVMTEDLKDAAVSANKARVECGLTEDQAVEFVVSHWK